MNNFRSCLGSRIGYVANSLYINPITKSLVFLGLVHSRIAGTVDYVAYIIGLDKTLDRKFIGQIKFIYISIDSLTRKVTFKHFPQLRPSWPWPR